MTKNDPNDLDAIRALADRLGLPGYDPNAAANLESAEDFVARMKLQDAAASSSSRDLQPWWNRRYLAVGSLVAAAALAAVLTLAIPIGGGTAYAETPPMLTYGFADSGKVAYAPGHVARPALLRLAAIAREAQTVDDDPSGTQLVETSGWYAQLDAQAKSDSARIIPTVRDAQMWADGTVTISERLGHPLTADGRGISARGGISRKTETIPPGSFDPLAAASLGADPAQVRRKLLQHSRCENQDEQTVSTCLVREIINLNERWVISPALRSAFWTVLASRSHIRSLGDVTDRAGRLGIGFAVNIAGPPSVRTILIISRQDGRLLGVEEVLTKDDPDTKVEAPAVYSFTAILRSSWKPESLGTV